MVSCATTCAPQSLVAAVWRVWHNVAQCVLILTHIFFYPRFLLLSSLVKAVANGHESYIAELKAEQAEDVKTGVELTFGKKFRNCVISTYDVCAASVLCALCCKVEDAAAPVADAKDTDTATTAPAGEAVAAPQV